MQKIVNFELRHRAGRQPRVLLVRKHFHMPRKAFGRKFFIELHKRRGELRCALFYFHHKYSPPDSACFSLLTVQSPLLNWKSDSGRRRPTHARECFAWKCFRVSCTKWRSIYNPTRNPTTSHFCLRAALLRAFTT